MLEVRCRRRIEWMVMRDEEVRVVEEVKEP
jgi:hypothetical protein